jgi:hypothetical protein
MLRVILGTRGLRGARGRGVMLLLRVLSPCCSTTLGALVLGVWVLQACAATWSAPRAFLVAAAAGLLRGVLGAWTFLGAWARGGGGRGGGRGGGEGERSTQNEDRVAFSTSNDSSAHHSRHCDMDPPCSLLDYMHCTPRHAQCTFIARLKCKFNAHLSEPFY